MKRLQVIVPWPEGLHLRPAGTLVRLAQASKSTILVKAGEKVANARSVLAILVLCATVGMALDLEIHGEDEDVVLCSIKRVFESAEFSNNSINDDSAT
jgi:phosphotransferase system HPr (HPr) family protein